MPTVIYDQPNGELVTYKRAGYGIWNYEELMKKASDSKYINEWINLSEQWGEANVVFAPFCYIYVLMIVYKLYSQHRMALFISFALSLTVIPVLWIMAKLMPQHIWYSYLIAYIIEALVIFALHKSRHIKFELKKA